MHPMGDQAGAHRTAAATTKRWFDREPLKIWIPVSAVLTGVLQTVGYLGYKDFYQQFGVKPEEVGYDYASLFPRTAFQITLVVTLALLGLALTSLLFAIAGAGASSGANVGVLELISKREWKAAVAAGTGSKGTLLIICVFGLVLNNPVGLLIPAIVTLLAVAWQHALPLENRSAPVYRDSRRLLMLLVFAGALVLFKSEDADWRWPFGIALAVFAIDRSIPVRPVREKLVVGDGIPQWLLGTLFLAAFAAAAFAALVAFGFYGEDRIMVKVEQVKHGQSLAYDPLNLWAIAEPRADRVAVRWIAPHPPPPFAACSKEPCDEVLLTYFGQSAGTSVFLSAERAPDQSTRALRPALEVYRLPTSAVVMRNDIGDA
jgi:hypothetical protein